MNKKFHAFLSTLIIQTTLYGKIIESNRIEDLKSYIRDNEKTIVVFDIDNTLTEPADKAGGTKSKIMGSDQWFYYLIGRQVTAGKSFEEALEIVLPFYVYIQMHTELKPVEPTTVGLVHELQKNNIPTIALTARSLPLINRTIYQLGEIDINFAHNQLTEKKEIRFDLKYSAYYESGMLFCNNNEKGSVLFAFLNHCGFIPDKIIFIDDKRKNLEDVEREAQLHDIPFVGIRYNYLDHKKQYIDQDQVDREYKEFLENFNTSLHEEYQVKAQ